MLRHTRRSNCRSTSRIRLACESLEDRRLLSASNGSFTRELGTAPLDMADPLAVSQSSIIGRVLSTTDVFNLQSKPDSNFTIYLDFDGHVTENTTWNTAYGMTTIVSPPFDLDGDPTSFAQSELERIMISWQRTAEDFAPFDINVTTRDPGLDALIRSGGGDTRWGARAVATFDTFANCGCGGHAYIDSFNDPVDTPTFVYNLGEGSLGETFSHEVGHMLNLFHDGTNVGGLAYYPGHGSGETQWGTIMGAPFDENVTTWNDGDYFDADNFEDDLTIITTMNGFSYRPDDFGGTTGSAAAIDITGGSEITAFGIIERNTDRDLFRFETGAGPVSIDIAPLQTRPNLDVWAGIFDSTGSLIAESNPGNVLSASFSNVNLAAGVYYLRVEGVGSHDIYNATTGNVDAPAVKPWQQSNPVGYSDYGSLGQYTIDGTIVPVGGNSFSITATDASKLEGQSGQQTLTFMVTRHGSTTGASQVDFDFTQTLPAAVGDSPPDLADSDDFAVGTSFSGTVLFLAGEDTQPVTFDVLGDTSFERDEFFDVQLSNASAGWGISGSRATGAILSDENIVGIPALSSTGSVNEGPFDGALVRWRQAGAASGAFDEWALDNITLTNSTFGDDFDPTIDNSNWSELSTGQVNNVFGGTGNSYFVTGIPDRRLVSRVLHSSPGDMLEFDIIFGDGINGGENADPGEDVFVEYSLDNGSSWSTFGVLDTEDYTSWTTVQFALPGNINTNPPAEMKFTISREGGTTAAATVDWEVLPTTAPTVSGDDFVGGVFPTGQATFAPGERTTEIVILVNGDVQLEQDELFSVVLTGTNSSAVMIDANLDTASGTIINDDADFAINPGPQFRWRQLDSSGGSFDNWGIDNVQLSNGTFMDDFDPDIDSSLWPTVSGGIVNNNFGGTGNSLFFESNDERTISSSPMFVSSGDVLSFDFIYGDDFNGGENPESGEEVVLEYSTDDGMTWSNIATYPLTITTWTTINVPIPVDAIPPAPIMTEGNSGTTTYSFEILRIGGGLGVAEVDWQIVGSGTSPADGTDFVGGVLPGGTLTFSGGADVMTLDVQVVADTTFEPDETFELQLASGATLTATILNDDMAPTGDFNGDGNYDCADIDVLTQNIAVQSGNPLYDLSGDGNLDLADVDIWLAIAGAINLPSGNAYLYGDADLNGFVDGQDFIVWNTHKFMPSSGWCSGDFNADGTTDGQDFIVWNSNKFTSAILISQPNSLAADEAHTTTNTIRPLNESEQVARVVPSLTMTIPSFERSNAIRTARYAQRADAVFAKWQAADFKSDVGQSVSREK